MAAPPFVIASKTIQCYHWYFAIRDGYSGYYGHQHLLSWGSNGGYFFKSCVEALSHFFLRVRKMATAPRVANAAQWSRLEAAPPPILFLAVRGNHHHTITYSYRREVGPALSLLCAYLEPAASPVCRKSLELRAPSRLPEKPHHTRPHTDPNHCKQPSVAPIKKCNLRSSVCHLASSGKQASRQGFHCFA